MTTENRFGEKLHRLMMLTNTKSVVLARELQYDLSYISKWISGKMLPSERNIDTLIPEIAGCLLQGNVEKALAEYNCSETQLEQIVQDELLQAYLECRPVEKQNRIQSIGSLQELVESLDDTIRTSKDVVALMDLFAMPHENRLILAGIRDGHFSYEKETIRYDLAICTEHMDSVYDSIFLIHLLTAFSGMDFRLYSCSAARGKLVCCMDEKAVSAMLFDNEKECIGLGELAPDTEMRRNISRFMHQENLIFRKTTLEKMIREREYIQSLMSTNVRWLLGHATELLIPEDVMEQLVADEEKEAEYRRMYQLSRRVLQNPAARIMIYESVMANLAMDGVLDFYNRKVQLNSSQILRCLEYYNELVDMGVGVRLIDGCFSEDFRYITNPCMFLADSICYLRLENNRYMDNILILNDRNMKDTFEDFFDTVWTSRPDVVTSEPEEIREKMQHYLSSAIILNNT